MGSFFSSFAGAAELQCMLLTDVIIINRLRTKRVCSAANKTGLQSVTSFLHSIRLLRALCISSAVSGMSLLISLQ